MTHLKSYFVIFIILSTQLLFCQNQSNHWIYGQFGINFKTQPPSVSTEFANFFPRASASMSDSTGRLLFYSNGHNVWNRNHELMPNGIISPGENHDVQKSVAIPWPGKPSMYYLFSVVPRFHDDRSGLYYSVIDMNLDNGLGDIVLGQDKLVDSTSTVISAVHNIEENFYWVVVREGGSNKYNSFKIDQNGLNTIPNITKIGRTLIPGSSNVQMKISTDGKKIALGAGNGSTNTGYIFDGVQLFDFNITNGALSNEQLFFLPNPTRNVEGVSFSPDATKLYVYQTGSSHEKALYQYDVSLPTEDIDASRTEIGNSVDGGTLQLAVDGHIYMEEGGIPTTARNHLGIILNPNEKSSDIKFGTLDIAEDPNGAWITGFMPTFIESYFFKTSFTNNLACTSDTVNFSITNTYRLDSAQWAFGDGSFSDDINPNHVYHQEGTYDVSLIAFYPKTIDTITKSINVYPSSTIDLGADTSLCKGFEFVFDAPFESYQWNTGDSSNFIDINESGTYQLSITNEFGCISSDSININALDLPVIDIEDEYFIPNGSDLLVDPGDFQEYLWSTGEGTQTIKIQPGTYYSVLVTDSSNCKANKTFIAFNEGVTISKKQEQWIRMSPEPSGFNAQDIHFLNKTDGYIITTNSLGRRVSELLSTTDGGKTWSIDREFPVVNKMEFKNNIGYVAGNSGLVYKSTYGGRGWNSISTGTNEDFISITLLDQDSIILTSSNSLHFSFDGGSTWDEHRISGINVTDSYFINKDIGVVVGTGGKIRKTMDGGVSWYTVYETNVFPSDFFSVDFANSKVGYASLEHDNILKTTDGGESWFPIESTTNAAYDIHFINEEVGYIGGERGTIYKTVNGGDSWNQSSSSTFSEGLPINCIYFVKENIGWAAGDFGKIVRTTSENNFEHFAFTNDDIDQLQFTSTEVGYIKASNKLFKTYDQGQTWGAIPDPIENGTISQIEFIDDNIGFSIVGEPSNVRATNNLIYKTVDGGQNWNQSHTEELTSRFFSCFDFVTADIGYACVTINERELLKTEDGGSTWHSISSQNLSLLQFSTENLGYAINIDGLIKTEDGGVTWKNIFGSNNSINSFYFINQDVGYLVGNSSLFQKTIDGGKTWEKIDILFADLEEVYFYNESFGYVLDHLGVLRRTIDGGKSWDLEFFLPPFEELYNFHDRLYLYGRDAYIYYNKIDGEDLVSIERALASTLHNEATATVFLRSNLDTTHLELSIGTNEDSYDIPIFDTTLIGIVNENFIIPIDKLTPETLYFGQYQVIDKGIVVASERFGFFTRSVKNTVQLNDIRVSDITDRSATISGLILSNLDTTSIFLELDVDSTKLIPNRALGTYFDETNETYRYDLDNLAPSTLYYARTRVLYDDHDITSDLISFETIAAPSMVADTTRFVSMRNLVGVSNLGENKVIGIRNSKNEILPMTMINDNFIDFQNYPPGEYYISISTPTGTYICLYKKDQ